MDEQATLMAFPLPEDPQAGVPHELRPIAVISEMNFRHAAEDAQRDD